MTAVKRRVVEERSELHARVGKLRAFLGTAPFLKLDPPQQRLLEAQAHVMGEYLKILDQRLALME